MTFTCFSCWIQFEEGIPQQKFCSPTNVIGQLQNYDPPQIAFHKEQIVDVESLFTSKTKALIFKESKVTVSIDDKKHKEIIGCENS